MSRTIITNSDSDFWTNINSEQMLGELCKEAGAKYFQDESGYIKLAYSMTPEEAKDASEKLKVLALSSKTIFPKYKGFLSKEVTINDFKDIIIGYATDFEKSEGYVCI
jgi:hypothetical protein